MGHGGWATAHLEGVKGHVRVRFSEAATGRLAVAAVFVDDEAGLSADSLRSIPIGRLEALANTPKIAAVIRERIGTTGDPVETAFADIWYAVTPEPWAGSPAVGLDDHGNVTAVTGAFGPGAKPSAESVTFSVKRMTKRDLKIALPKGARKKPDSFYERVAEVFSEAAAWSTRPAKEIAKANRPIEVTTVHRWVKEARRRGLLSPGEKGRGRG